MFTEPTHTRYENKTITYENSWRLDRNQWKFIINESFCVLKLMFTLFSCPKLLLYIADRSMVFQYSWIQLHIQHNCVAHQSASTADQLKNCWKKGMQTKLIMNPVNTELKYFPCDPRSICRDKFIYTLRFSVPSNAMGKIRRYVNKTLFYSWFDQTICERGINCWFFCRIDASKNLFKRCKCGKLFAFVVEKSCLWIQTMRIH